MLMAISLFAHRTSDFFRFTMVFSDTPNMSEKHFDGSGIAGSNVSSKF